LAALAAARPSPEKKAPLAHGTRTRESASRDFYEDREPVSAALKLANPRRIKAAHRRRWKCSTGHHVYANDNPYRYTDPDGRRIVINGTDEFKKKIQADIKKIAQGKGGKALVRKLEATKNIILIKQDVSHEGNSTQASQTPSLNGGRGKGSTVTFDPALKTGGKDANGSRTRPAYVGLAHEFGHARAIDIGKQSYDMGSGKPGTTPPSEIHSMANENMVRKEHDLPVRPSYYDDGH
jgi:hypothetical protein